MYCFYFDTKIQDVGSTVYALGYPLTQIMGSEIKFTDGKISSKSGFQGDITNYQISVPIQPGNSGGPLFNESGTLVGITSSGLNRQIADNANFAIKTSYLKLLIESMDDNLELPHSKVIQTLPVTEQIKTLSDYVVFIKVK
jgi:S1-C subfamily serine protease